MRLSYTRHTNKQSGALLLDGFPFHPSPKSRMLFTATKQNIRQAHRLLQNRKATDIRSQIVHCRFGAGLMILQSIPQYFWAVNTCDIQENDPIFCGILLAFLVYIYNSQQVEVTNEALSQIFVSSCDCAPGAQSQLLHR